MTTSGQLGNRGWILRETNLERQRSYSERHTRSHGWTITRDVFEPLFNHCPHLSMDVQWNNLGTDANHRATIV